MLRNITSYLEDWQKSQNRKPLLLKGARQIGKSYSVREFGKSSFENLVEVNLEGASHLKQIFTSNEPKAICSNLALQLNQPIIPGSTLLFIDEIQESKEALLALRYFREQLPELHVVAAGSLLDLSLEQDRDMKVPVGRIEYLYMHPLSFTEFLGALNETLLLDFIANLSLRSIVHETTHQKLLRLFNQYVVCGGMPAAVAEFINQGSNLRYRKIQADLIQTFQDDFRKYKTRIDYDKLETTFLNITRCVGRNFKLTELCPEYPQSSTKSILKLFHSAKIIHAVKCSAANGVPLGAEVNEKRNKYILLDVGLLNARLGVAETDITRWNHDLINSGAIAEQVVGQELLAHSASLFEPQLYYWARDKRGSTAEVDYLFLHNQQILPIEVKAGATGKLRSMRVFMEEKRCPIGIRFSQHELSLHENILSIPLYAINKTSDLLREALGN